MVVEDAPAHGEMLLTELGDRTFQWIFNQELSKEEQDDFVGRFVEMVASYLERFATPAGLNGISAAEFAAAVAAEAERADADGSRS